MIRLYVDHEIRIPLDQIDDDVFGMITEALTIPNLAREEAKRLQQWGWQSLPETIKLYEVGGAFLHAPRGFLADLVTGLEAVGYGWRVEDNMTFGAKFRIGTPIKPRPWQVPQMETIIDQCQGIVKSPAGSGKTVAVLGAIQKLACKSIVIVNTKDIMWQWMARAETFLGESYPVGQIGDGVFEVSNYLTIATAQTLHRRFDELERAGFFDEFSFVCLDECHHATAETYNRVLSRFSARYRIGVSATPDKTGDFALATNVLGPIIHETTPDEVSSLIKPTVYRISTQFNFSFRGASRGKQSNYPQLIQALIADPERNEDIARLIHANQGHHQLLVSKRLGHLDVIHGLLEDLGFPDEILTITGQDDSESRQEATQIAGTRPSLVLSTLADEALDIPRLDRLYLVFPQRNTGLITQQVGRVERVHDEKDEAHIYDFVDVLCPPLLSQFRKRRFEVYEPRGYKLVHTNVNQLMGME